MSDILTICANNYYNASIYNFEFCTGRKNKQKFEFNLTCLTKDFAHVVGLSHLKDMAYLTAGNDATKRNTFNKIKSGVINLSHVSKSDFFNTGFDKSYNAITQKEYTISDRIAIVSDIEHILDNAYKGKLYKWDLRKCQILLPNGGYRQMVLKASYVLVVPSDRHSSENIYIFTYVVNLSKSTANIKSITTLHIHSAFADCIDLTRGQEASLTILKESKYNIKKQSNNRIIY